jgi:hypothetical protein
MSFAKFGSHHHGDSFERGIWGSEYHYLTVVDKARELFGRKVVVLKFQHNEQFRFSEFFTRWI